MKYLYKIVIYLSLFQFLLSLYKNVSLKRQNTCTGTKKDLSHTAREDVYCCIYEYFSNADSRKCSQGSNVLHLISVKMHSRTLYFLLLLERPLAVVTILCTRLRAHVLTRFGSVTLLAFGANLQLCGTLY